MLQFGSQCRENPQDDCPLFAGGNLNQSDDAAMGLFPKKNKFPEILVQRDQNAPLGNSLCKDFVIARVLSGVTHPHNVMTFPEEFLFDSSPDAGVQ